MLQNWASRVFTLIFGMFDGLERLVLFTCQLLAGLPAWVRGSGGRLSAIGPAAGRPGSRTAGSRGEGLVETALVLLFTVAVTVARNVHPLARSAGARLAWVMQPYRPIGRRLADRRVAAGMLLTGLVLAAAAFEGSASAASLSDPDQGVQIVDRDGVVLFEFAGPNGGFRRSVNLDGVTTDVINATIAAEDADFWTNPGINFKGLARAVYENLAFWDNSGLFNGTGGSSITQQLARNINFSDETRYERSAKRKAEEILLALALTFRYSKAQILQGYLNQVYYGNSAYGIEAAAQRYFDKHASDLTLAEATLLAGLPQSPSTYDPLLSPAQRAQWPLDLLIPLSNEDLVEVGRAWPEGLGEFLAYFPGERLIDLPPEVLATLPEARKQQLPGEVQARIPAEAPEDLLAPPPPPPSGVPNRAAKERQLVVLESMVRQGYLTDAQARAAYQEPVQLRSTRFDIKAPHFVMHVLEQLRGRLSPQTFKGGLRVVTTLDWDLQQKAEAAVRDQLAATGPLIGAHNAALVALDPRTGEVLAMVGSADYFDPAIDGQVNMATALRQPGSTFKAFTYATAFAKGVTPATLLPDQPVTFVDASGRPYQPRNFDNQYRGMVTVRTAFSNSLNIPAVETVAFAGTEAVVQTAQRLGITTLDRPSYGLSLTLGAAEVRPLELAFAYGAFANNGRLAGAKEQGPAPVAVLSVEGSDGKQLLRATTASADVLNPGIAYLVTNILSDDEARRPVFGSSLTLADGRPAAVKTGTTDDGRDFWTVGYTPDLVTAVWMGNADNTPLTGGFSGSTTGPIWVRFMNQALAGQPARPFDRPPGVLEQQVCAETAQPPIPGCRRVVTDVFLADSPRIPALDTQGRPVSGPVAAPSAPAVPPPAPAPPPQQAAPSTPPQVAPPSAPPPPRPAPPPKAPKGKKH